MITSWPPGIEDPVEIGRGGFAVVYRARQPAFGRTVALKVIELTHSDMGARDRFTSECRIMGRLSEHPSVVHVYDAGFLPDGRAYIVMPLMPGGSLQDRLDTGDPFEWSEATDIGVRLASALHAAHTAGVTHCDVKPANVLVSEYGEAKLSDFGIARIAGRRPDPDDAITTSLAFAAPEVLQGEEPTVSADIFGLGATLFALMSGQPPFYVADGGRVVPSDGDLQMPDAIPTALGSILRRALAVDSTDRFESTKALADALIGFQHQSGSASTPFVEVQGLYDLEAPSAVPMPDRLGSAAATSTIDDRSLRIELDEDEYIFMPPATVTVGRAPDSLVRLSDFHSQVSREHLRVTWEGDHWLMEDLGSSQGTYLDGRRLKKSRRIEGSSIFMLGDPDAGTEMRVFTAGRRRSRVRTRRVVTWVAVSLAVASSLAALLLNRGGAAVANSPQDLANAREATVMVELLDEQMGRLGFRGSGVLVGESGLVLTNAHIAYADTFARRMGFEADYPDAPRFAVGFASVDGGELDRFYVAEPYILHPFHDAALVRIVADGNGDPDFEIPFRPLALGTSADLVAGDEVAQLGYPDAAATLRVSVRSRDFQSLAPCTGSQLDACLADLADGWINLSGQPLGGGSSGGPIVRGGRVVGINQGTIVGRGATVEQNRAIPIDLIVAEFGELAG